MSDESKIYKFEEIGQNWSFFFKFAKESSQNLILCDHAEHGQCLVLTRRPKGLSFELELVSPGGVREGKESKQSTARRETLEEISTKTKGLHKIGVVHNPFGYIVSLYQCQISESKLRKAVADPKEVEGIHLISIESLRQIKPVKVQKHFEYNSKMHTNNIKKTGGFTVEGDILKIKAEQLIHISGAKINDPEVILRPYSIYKLLDNIPLVNLTEKAKSANKPVMQL